MKQETVEKVARAILKADSSGPLYDRNGKRVGINYGKMAKAAITAHVEALMEPSGKVSEAGHASMVLRRPVHDIFVTMLRASLEETE